MLSHAGHTVKSVVLNAPLVCVGHAVTCGFACLATL